MSLTTCSKLLRDTFLMHSSIDRYSADFVKMLTPMTTTLTPTQSMSQEIPAMTAISIAGTTSRPMTDKTVTLVAGTIRTTTTIVTIPCTTTIPAMTTARRDAITLMTATKNRRTKTLTEIETCDDAMPTVTAAPQDPSIPMTIALDTAHPCQPLKPESCTSSRRTRIGRWRTC